MYVDGFVLPVPKKNLAAYKKMATQAGKVWRTCGALEYVEAIADDVQPGKVTSFPQSVKAKKGEVVVFAYVIYRSRAHRDQVNKRVMAHPAMKVDPKSYPFDAKRMFWGGFKPFITL